jgi:hypothetical protein
MRMCMGMRMCDLPVVMVVTVCLGMEVLMVGMMCVRCSVSMHMHIRIPIQMDMNMNFFFRSPVIVGMGMVMRMGMRMVSHLFIRPLISFHASAIFTHQLTSI